MTSHTLEKYTVSLAVLACLLLKPALVLAAHGISIDGEVKYGPDFERFEYTSPHANPGGTLQLHDLGSFDKFNPYTLKGNAPSGLSRWVFETLAVSSLDEPFSEYGLIAEDIKLADDGMSVTFTLNSQAHFSDGSPVTAEDVLFSLETLKSDQAHPAYQIYFHDIIGGKILGRHSIRFDFAKPNRELHMIAAQLPVLSKSFFSKVPFKPTNGKEALVAPIGSGPYQVTAFQQGKSVTFTKNPNYWAKEHPTRKGMFNFNSIMVKYFKDQIVSVEAFKAREFDYMLVNIAKQWQRDLSGRGFSTGELVKKTFPHKNNAGMQAFVFNTRRALFVDPLVRKALGLAFDFQWTNKTLFYGQYTRNNSFFSNSYLAASGLPGEDELALLEPFRGQLPPEVFTTPLTPPATTPPGSLRANMREAKQLLHQAGWSVENGILKDKNGTPFKFEMILAQPEFERVIAPFAKNLKRLGIEVSYRTIDPTLYTERVKNFDFDMTVANFAQSQSPGNEQRDYWSSSSASQKGSRNVAGVNNKVVDTLVDTIIYATNQKQLTTACRALDRVLWYSYYVIPNWYLNSHRVVYNARLRHPEQIPLYYSADAFLDTWWFEGK